MPEHHPHILPIRPDAPWLAPLAGYSDLPFRLLCRENGAAVCCTEMVSAKGMHYSNKGTSRLLDTEPADAPLVVQLFGSEARYLDEALTRCVELGFSWFDLNAGCPVPKVVKTGAGAALSKAPDQLHTLVRAMVDAANRAGLPAIPPAAGPGQGRAVGRVGAKIRLGWDMGEDRADELALAVQEAGAGWLTLHPRHARQGYAGTAQWAALARVKALLSIPVIASGDLILPEDGVRCVRETGVDGLMFARGALANPAICAEYLHLLAGGEPAEPSPERVVALIRRHVALFRSHGSEHLALLRMRTIVPRYVKRLPDAGTLRRAMALCRSFEESEAILESYLHHCRTCGASWSPYAPPAPAPRGEGAPATEDNA
ncbi:MAG: tRNA dihydrouridine synthase [Desulfovibrionaceae bacterium]